MATRSSALTDRKEPKKAGGAPPNVVIQKLDVRGWNRTEQDVPKWRMAIKSFEGMMPRRQLLYTLYADVMLDGHVEAVWGKRQDAVCDANWKYLDANDEEVGDINDLIDSIGFDDLLKNIIDSRAWNYSIMEPRFWRDDDGGWEMDAGLIPRLHYLPEEGLVTEQANGISGINIREGIYAKTVMEVGDVKDLGLLAKAALYQVLKRGGLGDWAAFIQTFGNPLIDAVWDGYDEKQRIQLNDALNKIGPGGVVIRPAGTEIDIRENNTKDTGDAHGHLMNFLNTEISKALLGTTETTQSSQSSGYAQSKTHEAEDERKHDNDITFVRKVLNSRFKRILAAHGFDTRGGRFVVQGEETELTKKEMFEIHRDLADKMGLPIDHDFLYETYGVAKPENYDELMAKKEADEDAERQRHLNPPPPEPGKGDPAKTGKRPAPKKEDPPEKKEPVNLSEKAWYLKLFERFFPEAPAVTTGAITACSHHHTIKLNDAEVFDNDGLVRRVWDANGKLSFDARLFYATVDTLVGGFKKGWDDASRVTLADAPGFEYGALDPALLTAFEQNLFRFAGTKTLVEIQALNQIFRESSSFDEFYQAASARAEIFNKDWLETEYATAVLTGEAASTYHRLKGQADIFPYWMYRDQGDDLVRKAHRLLDGIVLPANDARWNKLFPPNGWRCRCYVLPRLKNEVSTAQLQNGRERADAYLGSPQGKKETDMGWGVNRADSGEVFTAAQRYAGKFPGKAGKKLDGLRFHDFGLKSYSRARKVATDEVRPFEGSAREFYDALEEFEGQKVVRDYHKRPLKVDPKNFARHSTERKAYRSAYIDAMQETLKSPDEVWMSGSKMDNVVYLKYYKGKTIIVVGNIRNGRLELKSWFDLAERKDVIKKYRKGLLVVRK
jgi:SPP1 gp7 family putative phage head morphogenesis protein